MYEEYTKINAFIFKLSAIFSLVAAGLILVWFISFFLLPQPDAQNSIEENIIFVANHPLEWSVGPFIMFLFTLIQVPIIVGIFSLTRRLQYFLSNLAGISGLVYFIFCSQTYFRLFTSTLRLARQFTATGNDLEKYALIANFNGWGHLNGHSFAFNHDMLGSTFLGITCILFGVSLISSIKLRTLTGWLLLTSGFLSILGTIGYILQHKAVEMGTLVAAAFYFFSCIAMFPMFSQESQVLQSIASKN
ncbi:DUF4386 family protein [candidate division KSB1 bacterium]|nr:DUF4386 family protein [candidate division KSB1 bacterium]